jgi:hypothetical protein
MKLFVSFAVCCSAICACALDQPVDAPPDSGAETQQAIEPAAQQDEAQDEATESLACAPEDNATATASSIAPRAEGDDDHPWTPITPIGWVLDHLFGHHKHKMDPEPDRFKNRKSCWDWCNWNRRQCEKECRHLFPDPHFNERNRCIRSCKTNEDPNKGLDACTGDCNSRFPERPIITVAP